ncbi:MAG: NADH-quinone oxidoreductase subunit NuoB, partial [Dehalococcoidia bacterium]|nr:NADH-quinone oxidoreductase subunit NuoB [Dehalococcoidia bacterium]
MEIDHSALVKEIDISEGREINSLIEKSRLPFADPDLWLEGDVKRNAAMVATDAVLNWGRLNSIYMHATGPACCIFEFLSAFTARFDVARFGWEIFRPSPRQADVFVIAETVTWKMAVQLRRLYDQMPEPKWVVAMGACAISGGTFREPYSVVPGVNRIMPVDIYIPGCPPEPHKIWEVISFVVEKLSTGQSLPPKGAILGAGSSTVCLSLI